ncbi:hypothetical protein A8F94_18385 [Bacillus sp. FJAT-27225]|uniref:nuclease-related domain-containing protein n=1 Tax=Bacillus sp. FJAT-27225 TaxID=1743144 RepID=UPI00080C3329|nr:nuclease-related domain-containing protein [Bacillus sp. FJAT-27225]OCA83100.1 hypothetical protein A8F94_18385 [Bacillus sp. FJAT-27225]
MLHKARTKSEELKILEYLDSRMNLEEGDKNHLIALNKGYEGEVLFDKLTAGLTSQGIVLNDLRFKVKNTNVQIDTTIIFQKTLKFYEVKNHEGDYYFSEDKYFSWNGTEWANPLHQMRREETFYRLLLDEIGCNLKLEPSLLFINPAFTMYNAPFNEPIIYPTQLQRHMDMLNNVSSNLTSHHWSIADKLLSRHIEKSDFIQLPSYNFKTTRKGFTCAKCKNFSVYLIGRKILVCSLCTHEEGIEAAVLRSVEEIKLLFPDLPIGTGVVQQWCVILSTKVIKAILDKHFRAICNNRWTYYI